MSQKEEILRGLAPLFAEAKEKGLWFQGMVFGHDEIKFSLKELREQHEKGKYIWSAENWKLINPRDILASLNKKIDQVEDERRKFIKRMEKDAPLPRGQTESKDD